MLSTNRPDDQRQGNLLTEMEYGAIVLPGRSLADQGCHHDQLMEDGQHVPSIWECVVLVAAAKTVGRAVPAVRVPTRSLWLPLFLLFAKVSRSS